MNIQLSGFGINLKTTITKVIFNESDSLGLKVLPVLSDSALINDMYHHHWASFDPEDRCRFRYHQIMSCINNYTPQYSLIIDRGIVDQICFARLIDRGILPKTIWFEGSRSEDDDYKFIEDYVEAENNVKAKKFFIFNKNESLVNKVLKDEEAAGVEIRSYFSKTFAEYMKNQIAFYEEYKSIIPNHTLFEIPNSIDSKGIDKFISAAANCFITDLKNNYE